ncbi:hypothetical protein [Streptomyces sp. NBC_01637]|uniref:hypothetical protein n=1 Tax=unclassified Streptomyces TaxID=2593676 RepID=UPI003864E471|nr:hypothetical protein OH719_25990 [Streptomyces sp. NBC_01653]WTD89868.1 hypothetical protein OG891_20880 [Streptomyces sp. NBC_01637]
MSRAAHLARRLVAVEQKRDGRRLAHTYRLTDGRTVRLSTLDMLRTLMDGLALNGKEPPEPPPVARDMAQLPPDDSMMGATMRAVAVEWCEAYDEGRLVVFHPEDDEDDEAAHG